MTIPWRIRTSPWYLGNTRASSTLRGRIVQRKARDSNPHALAGALVSTEARPAISGYLPSRVRSAEQSSGFFHTPHSALRTSYGPTGNRTRISATPGRCRPVGPWALEGESGPPGSRTPISGVRCRRRPVGPAARLRERTGKWNRTPMLRVPSGETLHPHVPTKVRPRIELGPPPYQGGVLPEHLRTARLGVVPAGLEPA